MRRAGPRSAPGGLGAPLLCPLVKPAHRLPGRRTSGDRQHGPGVSVSPRVSGFLGSERSGWRWRRGGCGAAPRVAAEELVTSAARRRCWRARPQSPLYLPQPSRTLTWSSLPLLRPLRHRRAASSTSLSPDPGSHSLIASPLQHCLLHSIVCFRARVVFLSHLKGAGGQTFFLTAPAICVRPTLNWVAVNTCFMGIYFADRFRITLLPASCLLKTVHLRTLL